jgi:ABC-type sugar transport system ATPase subunit
VPALRLAGVSQPPLAAFDLEVARGELVVLSGPSGSGKSTALRIIAGLESPRTGRVFLGDVDVTDIPPARRDIAIVSQGAALYPHLSVYENLAFALRVLHVDPAELARRVEVVAAELALERLLSRRPSQLSEGERQRVAIGRALARRPRVYLFDEPLSSLDAASRVAVRAAILRAHRDSGATTIYATFDPVDAAALGDRIVALAMRAAA